MKTAEIELLVLKDGREGQAGFDQSNRLIVPPGAEFPVEQKYSCPVFHQGAIRDTKNSLLQPKIQM